MAEGSRFNRDEVRGNDDLGPLCHCASVTPADNADLSEYSRAIICGTAGNIKVDFVSGDTVTLEVDAKVIYPFSVKRVYSTSTTAGNIFSLR